MKDELSGFLSSAGLGFLDSAMGMLAGGVQQGRQKDLMSYQYKLNEQAAKAAYDRQLDFWNRNNQYNSFANQKSLMQAAGLNPALMYSDGTAGALAGGVSAPQGSGSSGGSSQNVRGTDFLNAALVAAQIRNIDADTAQKQGNTLDPYETQRGQRLANDLVQARVLGQDVANDLASLDLRFRNEVYDTEVQIRKQTADNMAKQYDEMVQRIAESVSKQHLNEEQIKQSASLIALNMSKSILARTQAYWHGKISRSQINEAMARIENLVADSGLKSAQEITEFAKQANLYSQKMSFDASARYYNALASEQESHTETYNSSAGQLVREIGVILDEFSPLRFGRK